MASHATIEVRAVNAFWGRNIRLVRRLETCRQLRHIFRSWINVLLIFVPVGITLALLAPVQSLSSLHVLWQSSP
ncbi:hypothetical protein B0H10DRAFT_2083948 [Mycena sp. CBHHK59/15]|nr:hypothetical protein B0H10DRAFT_2083948 [Mycena sp. CBHHK59/15]